MKLTTETLRDRTRRRGWLIFWILAFGYVLVYFHRLCPAVVAVDMMRDLNAGAGLIGFLGSAYFYPYAVMQLPAGLLSDSWGPRKTVTFFFVVAFIGSLLLGVSNAALWAIVGRALVGLGVAMLFVPAMKVLAVWFEPRKFATMVGILHAMGGIGSLTAAAPLALLSVWIGWRMSFVAVGVVTFVLAVLVWIVVRDHPPDADRKASAPAEKQDLAGLLSGMKMVIASWPIWPLGVWFFCMGGIFFSFGGLWGGPYLIQVYHFSKAQAGQILSMLAVGMIVGGPFQSFLSNRVLKGRKPVLILAALTNLAAAILVTVYTGTMPIFVLYLLCFGLGFSSGAVAVGFTTAKELFPNRIAGTATGFINLFPFLGGALLQPFLGYVLESHGRISGAFTPEGYGRAFLVLFFCALVGLLASLFLRETMQKQPAAVLA